MPFRTDQRETAISHSQNEHNNHKMKSFIFYVCFVDEKVKEQGQVLNQPISTSYYITQSMRQDFPSILIQFESQELDRQMQQYCPFLALIKSETLFKPPLEAQNPMHDSHESHQDSSESYAQSTDSQDSPPLGQPSDSVGRNENVPTRSQQQTKNFLQNFKHHHINYLSQALTVDLNSYQIIRELRAKSGINRQDYQQLYREPDFKDAFEEMFESRFLYDMLKQSRSKSETKDIHELNLFVFERAFQNKSFPKIKMYRQNFH